MRHDHSKWLMHFVRDRIPEQDFPGETEEEYLFHAGGELEHDADAFAVLKTIIRLGGMRPGYSFRNGKTTIYGGQPALCVTEMPLYSFADYARSRNDSAKVSAYGLAFLTSEFYGAGGRPAIYGLSTDSPQMDENSSYSRIFANNVLPRSEQYRYVAYNPSSKSHWIDWSHEREWRWIPQDEDRDQIWVEDHNGMFGPVPALPQFKGKENGCEFNEICIIVWTKDEAAEIQELLTGFYLAESYNYDTPFDRGVIAKSKIIVLTDVILAVESGKHLQSQTIQGLEAANLLEPILIASAPPNAMATSKKAFELAGLAADEAQAEFRKSYGEGDGYCGFAHVTTTEVTHPMVQFLLENDMASGPFDGRVWINVPVDSNQSVDFERAGCDAAAKSINKSLGITAFVEWRYD